MSGSKAALEEVKEIKVPASALKMTELTERTEQVIDIAEYIPDGVNYFKRFQNIRRASHLRLHGIPRLICQRQLFS